MNPLPPITAKFEIQSPKGPIRHETVIIAGTVRQMKEMLSSEAEMFLKDWQDFTDAIKKRVK